jgi:predicted kinase
MKSLSLSRPLVIIVIGLPGSGKSFFARQFADMFGAPLVSVDFIRHALSPQSQYVAEEDALVNALAHSQTVELLKTGKTFVIDGGLNHRAARLAVERLASKHGYGKLTIWVQTDEPTSLSRSMKRSAKRQTDELNAPMDAAAFARYRKQFGIPTPSENIVVISGKHTFATQARVILKKLVAPRDTVVTVRPPETNPEQKPDVQPRRRSVTIN